MKASTVAVVGAALFAGALSVKGVLLCCRQVGRRPFSWGERDFRYGVDKAAD